MRMLPTRYLSPKPARVKQQASQVAHVSAPLKGLNMSSKLTTGDPLTAPILTNFVVDDDRITVRAGYRHLEAKLGGAAVVRLVPYYGPTNRLAAAGGGRFEVVGGGALKTDFNGSDWSWTAFANLGQQKFTVMCNGFDGVWSWDGGSIGPGAVLPITAISNANPAVCTVADTTGLSPGENVLITGFAGDFAIANGNHAIGSVTPTTFALPGVDTSAATGSYVSGATAQEQGSLVKENVTAPPGETWANVDKMNIVLAHMNRLFFADTDNLAVFYLPLQQKSGELKVLPLNALFRRGGTIRAMYSWTVEGGVSTNDQLCIFSSNGECVMYSGTDPDTDFSLTGIFRFDAPMSKHSIVQFGGDLYVLISTGLVPMSTMLKVESEQLGQVDKAVISVFLNEAIKFRDRAGWATFINPSSNRVICNIPQGSANSYTQMVRHMPRPVWSQWADIPARCWAWVEPYVYFGDDDGNVFQMHPDYRSDDGEPIRVDVQMAWSMFKAIGIKHFKMVRVYTVTDGVVRPFLDVKTDYDLTPPQVQPDVSVGTIGATWDLADWDTSDWASGAMPFALWNGVGALGRVGAPRFTALIKDSSFSITGFDVVFEMGAVI